MGSESNLLVGEVFTTAGEQAAWVALASVSMPGRLDLYRSEVERRWRLHVDFARSTPAPRLGREAAVRSVYRDVVEGLI